MIPDRSSQPSAEGARTTAPDRCPQCGADLPPPHNAHALVSCPGCWRIVARAARAGQQGSAEDDELPCTD